METGIWSRPLHARRRRVEELAKQEAAGVNFWSAAFDQPTRTKIMFAFVDAAGGDPGYPEYARAMLLRSEGLLTLRGRHENTNDFAEYVMECSDEMMPSVVEAMLAALMDHQSRFGDRNWEGEALFRSVVTAVLREHRVSFELIESELVPIASRELHEAVLAPALTLLGGRGEFVGAERAYMNALHEIHAKNGRPEDAITDAGTALQETLSALGYSGNALGPIIADARKKGLFASHDGPLLEAVMKWVGADRSEMGDAHHMTSPTVDDAWLLVHVVGALILRLAQGGARKKLDR